MIERVLAPNPGPMTGQGTNTYLIEGGSGELAVVDPGPDEPAHLDAIVAAAQRRGRITTVIVTHRHADHLPAAFPLCERTGATLLGHPGLPGVQRALQDQERCFAQLQALFTPGHTRESLCLWDPKDGSLFSGDLVAGSGTVIVDDQPGGLRDYMQSLERLLSLRPRTIYPGHGPLVSDAVGKLEQYLGHRRQREQQVLSAIESRGSASVEDLVAAIYVEVSSVLRPMAARNVLATLQKLESERRVFAEADRWRLAK